MSFERQNCERCHNMAFCVDLLSISEKQKKTVWMCEYCLGFNLGYALQKDRIRQIMIAAGIEDLENVGV